MAFSAVEKKNQIVDALRALSTNTEKVYMSIANTYPLLITEMRQSLSLAERMLQNDESGDGNHAALLNLVEETRRFIGQSNQTFLEANAKDQEITLALTEELGAVTSINQYIEHIRNDSSAMELISLNAMTVAVKAGIHGRAFSVITEELQRLSTRTIDLANLVTMQGESLIERFTEFRSLLQELTADEKQILGGFTTQINASFEEFLSGVKTITRTILELRKRSEKILDPLTKMMSGVQGHDLIRQSIDHVILSLQEIRPLAHDADLTTILDELSFLELLPDLSIELLNHIAEQIKSNKGDFELNLDRAQELIDSLENERSRFIRSAMDADNPASLLSKFENSQRTFDQLFLDIETLYKRKARTVERSHAVQYMVKEMDGSFNSFDSLITRFRTIDVASRIEIAKQEVLAQMAGTVNEMTALTQRIESDVSESANVIKSFLASSQQQLDLYRKSYLHSVVLIRNFNERLRKRSSRLNASKDQLIESIILNQVFSQSFMAQFGRTREDLDGLEALLRSIQEQKSLLLTVKTEIQTEKKRLMGQHGIPSWKLGNQKFREMIERFTIFTHKKIAGQMAGFTVEEGATSGDITLF